MEIYVHTVGREDPDLVEVEGTQPVRELLTIGDAGEAELVMIEESEEPLDLDITVEAAGIGKRHHVHRGRCRRVRVFVRYNTTLDKEFRPTAKVRQVFEWATGPGGFNLTAEEKAKHVLAQPGADHFLDWEVRVGTLVTAGTCDVTLDLAPRSRFEG